MRRAGSDGFTLIEMMIVLVILGILVAVTLRPLAGPRHAADMRTATLEIASALRLARSVAITSGRAQIFALNTASGAFMAANSRAVGRLPADVHAMLTTVTSERSDERTGSIRFFADGSATGGGVKLEAGQRTAEITVDWLTGRIAIDDHADRR